MKSFLALTYHFIDSSFKLRSGLVDFLPIEGSHTGLNIASSLMGVFNEFNIKKSQVIIFELISQVLTITCDNASNNDVMIEKLISEGFLANGEHQIRCFAHVLNLTAQELLKFIDYLVEQIRVNAKFIRYFIIFLISISL
jgi:hypothetical protein